MQKLKSKVADAKARAFSETPAQSMVDQAIGVMIVAVVIIAVAIPVVQDVIEAENLTGTTATIVDLVPLALGLAAFIAGISLVR